MSLVLIATVATYVLPILAGLYGGAGSDNRYVLWGQEEEELSQGIGSVMESYGITSEKMNEWEISPSREFGWQFPESRTLSKRRAGKKIVPLPSSWVQA